MSKAICEICGTSYPANADKCPICGYVPDEDVAAPAAATSSDYVPVKGGRFSSSNVKKRAGAFDAPRNQPAFASAKKKKKSNVGAIIVIVLLLLAILAVGAYIALRFFIPNDFLYQGLDGMNFFGSSQQGVPAEPESDAETEPEDLLDCKALNIRVDVSLADVGAAYQLVVAPVPADTDDQITYATSDDAVAVVDETGLITAVGEGTAVITVTCGDVTTDCYVTVTVPEEVPEVLKLALNRKEIEFKSADESWMLYDGEIDPAMIVWSTDDSAVATIEDGKVVAVGNGETIVQGMYDGQIATCLITCTFEDDEEDPSVSEATGEEEDDNKTYSLHNPQGQANDVTIGVRDTFVLQLVDEEKNVVTDAQWTVEDTNVCTYADGTVTGVHGGMTKVSATYKGKTYTCIVRVA